MRWLNLFTTLFPVWVLLCSGLALYLPGAFTWFGGRLIILGLAVIMLGMGITLSFDDFRRVGSMPVPVFTGVAAQFIIMPLLGWGIARGLALEPQLAVGLILVACCPGGTASNVVSYLARADVALSVLMTMCSTFAAVLLTPILTKLLAGAYVPVDAWELLLNTFQVVVLPVTAGLILNHVFPRIIKTVMPIAPPISVIFIALICASIIGANAETVKLSGGKLFGAVALLHLGGFALGYGFARVFGCPSRACRTIAIEVGMQNSGLGAVLARSAFPHFALAPVPAAISASFHSLIGSILAAWWRSDPPSRKDPPPRRAVKSLTASRNLAPDAPDGLHGPQRTPPNR